MEFDTFGMVSKTKRRGRSLEREKNTRDAMALVDAYQFKHSTNIFMLVDDMEYIFV